MMAATHVCSELHEDVKGKVRRRRVEDLEALIGNEPDMAPKGERGPCRERHGEQGGRVVHYDVDIGHGPRKDVFLNLFTVDKHNMQRPGVLGSKGVSCDIRKDFLHITDFRMTGGEGCEKQPGEGR